MELPKYHETFVPVLETLNSVELLNSRELASRVRDNYYSDLPQELLNQKTSSGANVLLDRILWGKSYLKMAKFVLYPKRGMVQIADKGKKAVNEQLQLDEVVGGTNFLEFYSEENSKAMIANEEIKNSTPQDLIDKGFFEIETALLPSHLLNLVQHTRLLFLKNPD